MTMAFKNMHLPAANHQKLQKKALKRELKAAP